MDAFHSNWQFCGERKLWEDGRKKQGRQRIMRGKPQELQLYSEGIFRGPPSWTGKQPEKTL
jgi:hypothetical protein